jgi:tetratricopeptide (TPR) repeat protein
MATGDTVGADAELRRLLLLAPADAWAWVILGNLNFRQNFALAERYFRRAVELSPTDPYAWNGMGVMYSEKHDYPKAIAAFESALKENPKFAHAHLGLATALADSGELQRAFEVLERMFSSSVVQDTRAMPTFERAGRFYLDLAKRLAQESIEAAEAEVETIAREAERVSGFPVQIEEGDFGVQMTASTELAWKHGRDHHVIRIRILKRQLNI